MSKIYYLLGRCGFVFLVSTATLLVLVTWFLAIPYLYLGGELKEGLRDIKEEYLEILKDGWDD